MKPIYTLEYVVLWHNWQKYYIALRHKRLFLIFFLFSLLITHASWSKVCVAGPLSIDTVKAKRDSVHVKTRKEPLESKVEYHARDSIRLDAARRKVYLYGNAVVTYQNLELKAAYIEISLDSNIAYAQGVQDSGKVIGKPEFHQGSDVFNADEIRYNFKSKKGRINQIYTRQGEGYIHGKTVKKDSNNVFYIKNGRYTTCNDEADPHFYIQSSKLKVIPHDQVVTGPAYLVIEGVPTPLAIPFGFFPLTTGRKSGILIPAYGESQSQGFFLQNGGYYLGLSDHFDMQLRGDIYSNESWAARDIITYDDRYHYRGSLQFAYSDTRLPVPESSNFTIQHNFLINWQHAQDAKARPGSTFMASVNAGSSNYLAVNSYNPGQFLQNTLQSNISFSKNFTGTPLHLSMNAEHSQNTITHQVDITLPELTLTSDRIYPAKLFESNSSGHQWYNNIAVGFSANATNHINTLDSMLFKPKTLNEMQNGANFTIPVSANFQIFRYFTLTPSYTRSSIMYFQTVRENLNHARDSIVTDTVQGLQMVSTYNSSATLTTNLYGMYSLGVKKAVLIRQVFFPSVSFSYHPDYSAAAYGYYRQVQIDTTSSKTERYSIFKNGIYGGPGAGKAGMVLWSLGTNLEMKIRVRTDSGSSYKKIKILERLAIGSSYNFAADSFQLANFSVSGNTTLFKKLAVNFSSIFDPYKANAEGYDTRYLDYGHGLGRLVSADLSFSTTITGSKKSDKNNSSAIHFDSPDQYFYYEQMHPAYWAPIEIAPWSLTIYYNYLYSVSASDAGPEKNTSQSLMFNGSVKLSKFWYVSVNSGYDLRAKQLTSTFISARRDMHCWELDFSTIPFGYHQMFTLDVHVKSSVLQDLKLQRQRSWVDTQQYSQ